MVRFNCVSVRDAVNFLVKLKLNAPVFLCRSVIPTLTLTFIRLCIITLCGRNVFFSFLKGATSQYILSHFRGTTLPQKETLKV